MTETVHDDNATPTASDDDVKRMDADTPGAPDGAAVDDQGVGQNPTDSTDTDVNSDPKSAARLCIPHRAPTARAAAATPRATAEYGIQPGSTDFRGVSPSVGPG